MKLVYQSGHTDTWCDGAEHVTTEGGYVWPHTPFEQKQRKSAPYRCDCAYWRKEQMNFGDAITALKMGQKVQRAGWNGKGMYLFLVVPIEPDLEPYITMFTAQQRFQPGWLASQADMLANDWSIVDA